MTAETDTTEASSAFKLDANVQRKMEARTEERDRKRAEQEELRDPDEDAFKIHDQFKASVGAIQKLLSAAEQAKKAGAEVAELEHMFTETDASYSSVNTFTSERALHLPAYDQRQMQIALKELQQTMSDTRLVCIPPTKFSFKMKRKARLKNKASAAAKEAEPAAAPAESSVKIDVPEQPSISDKVGEEIYMVNEGGKDLNIANCKDCVITIRGVVGAMYINNVVNCTLWIGPVGAGMLVEKAEQCKFFVASHQLRIHNAKQTDFFCLTNSPPIIEHSDELRFAPNATTYAGFDEDLEVCGISRSDSAGNWNEVKDFDWLRQQHSPHWAEVPEDDRSVHLEALYEKVPK